jgi:hypothetical protein
MTEADPIYENLCLRKLKTMDNAHNNSSLLHTPRPKPVGLTDSLWWRQSQLSIYILNI